MRLLPLCLLLIACTKDAETDDSVGDTEETDETEDTTPQTEQKGVIAVADLLTTTDSATGVTLSFFVGDLANGHDCAGGGTAAPTLGPTAAITTTSDTTFTFDSAAADFAAIVSCVTNGADDTMRVRIDGANGNTTDTHTESELGLGSPDLAGEDIDEIRLVATGITHQNVGSLLVTLDLSVQFWGPTE